MGRDHAPRGSWRRAPRRASNRRAVLGSLSLYRASASRPYASDDIQHVSQVLPQVAAGARGAWASRIAASAARPAEGPGTIIVTAAGAPLTATPQARRWLARLGPDLAGRHSQAIIYAITALLTAAASAKNAAPEATLRTRTTDGHWLDIHAAPLEGARPAGPSPSRSKPQRHRGSARC